MPYPNASPVTGGQPTQSAHYNNLLIDTLYLGNAAADSDLLANLVAAYQTGLTLQYLATNRVRVPATAAAPVRLVVAGAILSAVANVDLAPGAAPTGGAQWYYVFAVKTPGSNTFTLSLSTTPSETATTRLIGQFWWDGSAITRLVAKPRLDSNAVTGLEMDQTCFGRLSLSSGVPVTTSDVTGATVLYFTPYNGNYTALWEVGFGWRIYYFTELSLAIGSFAANKNWDIFLYSNAGTPALDYSQWTTDTVRSVNLVLQDGVWVKSGDPTRRYLGTIRTTGTIGQCEDSQVRRFVWNYYNRVPSLLLVAEATSHSYNGAERIWNNSYTNNKLEFVIGIDAIGQAALHFQSLSVAGTQCLVTFQIDTLDMSPNMTLESRVGAYMRFGTARGVKLSTGYHYADCAETSGAAVSFIDMLISLTLER